MFLNISPQQEYLADARPPSPTGPWLQPGVLLHFHEFYTGPHRARGFAREDLSNSMSNEMRALRDFLVDSKESQQLTLRLLPLRNPRIFDATVFEVV